MSKQRFPIDGQHAYAAISRTCGSAVTVMIENPNNVEDLADEVAEHIKAGYIIDYLLIEQGRQLWGKCKCEERP